MSDNEKKRDDELPPLALVDDGAVAAINARPAVEPAGSARYQQAYFSQPDELPASPPIEDDSAMVVLQAAMVARTPWENRTEQAVFSPPDELPVFVPIQDDSAMIVIQASWAQRSAWVARNAPSFFSPPDELPTPLSVLLAATLFYPVDERSEGRLVQASMIPLLDILRFLERDPDSVYGIDPIKWEEIIAASYDASGLFDEVILTPRSGDGGKDVVGVIRGIGRIVESIKRKTPRHLVTADDVRVCAFQLLDERNVKARISTTWEFAPKLRQDPLIDRLVKEQRLELLNRKDLFDRFKEYTMPKKK